MTGTSVTSLTAGFPPLSPAAPTRSDGVSRESSTSYDPTSSMALLRRAQAGDGDALNDLCARYLPRLHRWARGRLPGWARGALDTQDLVQLALTKVARQVPTFEIRHDGAFQGYVRRALVNELRTALRAAARRGPAEPLESDWVSAGPSPLEEAIGRELLDRYDAALEQLSDSDRDAIVARVELELAWPEVAEALGKNSAASAQMAVTRALVRLAREMSCEPRR